MMQFLKNSIARITNDKIGELESKIIDLEASNSKLRDDLNALIEASCSMSDVMAKLAVSNGEAQKNIAILAEYFCNISEALISIQSNNTQEGDWGLSKDKKQYLN